MLEQTAIREVRPARRRTSMARVAVASSMGSIIEFYDFLIYGTAAALVFPQVFFPALGTAAGTLASFGTFAVAFVSRPLGAILFGHFGDRLGRKKTLVSTLLIMGIATVTIGLLPDASMIGVAAPIILVLLRFLQGFAVGGEWAGAALLAAEYAPPKRRGLYAAFPQLGPSIAFALASGTFLIINLTLGDTSDAFLSYGWRIPFILSAVLVVIGLYIRLKIEETPVFTAETEARVAAPVARKLPVWEVVRNQPRQILLGGASTMMLFAFFYTGTAFLSAYGTNPDGLAHSRPTILSLGILGALVFAIGTIASAIISDRLGRRPVIVASCMIAVPWALALFPILDIGTEWSFALGLAGTLLIVGGIYGPVGAYLPELFATRYRYTGAGMAYNLGALVGGGITPLVAASIGASLGSYSIGLLLAGVSVVSLLATFGLPETKGISMKD
ncbi:MFS transporter [Cryobacterium psychrophilum]|uniref:Putative proline/betaine transporter n=1 Tax=Cryobacterium psychrophilum TaxID=41988 RepID=A0A4Y8KV61_9MICO|nr:MFS transporter [Cryobacterium psychrophilum]TDW28677.1 metabolite-proton symporter [Cryobacterium psychrophilum]TFD82337.1 MFS transporter [Cryobacterium psychrophilum]